MSRRWTIWGASAAGLLLAACGEVTTGNDATDSGGDDARDAETGEVADGDCNPDLHPCDGECVDLDNDPRFCGSCDNACPGGDHADPACSEGLCALACQENWYDLDDTPGCEYLCNPSSPGAEICDGEDNDCDGTIDSGFDCRAGDVGACETPCGTEGTRRCGDGCSWNGCEPPPELCDGIDQDCNGLVDETLDTVLWDVPAVTPSSGRSVFYYSPHWAAGQAGLGYILTTSSSSSLGQPRLQRFDLGGGATIGAPAILATDSTAYTIRTASSRSFASFVWDTGEDTGATGGAEQILFRGADYATPFTLGTAVPLDADRLVVSSAPAVARFRTGDRSVVAWIERQIGSNNIEVTLVSDYADPVVDNRKMLTSMGPIAAPDVAVAEDVSILLVWVRLDTTMGSRVYGTVMDAELSTLTDVMELSADASEATFPRVAAASDRYLVVWMGGGATPGVQYTMLTSGGELGPAGELFAANGGYPTVAGNPGAGLAVAYVVMSDNTTQVERYSPVTEARFRSATLPGMFPEIAAIPEGGYLVAYLLGTEVRLARIGCRPTDGG